MESSMCHCSNQIISLILFVLSPSMGVKRDLKGHIWGSEEMKTEWNEMERNGTLMDWIISQLLKWSFSCWIVNMLGAVLVTCVRVHMCLWCVPKKNYQLLYFTINSLHDKTYESMLCKRLHSLSGRFADNGHDTIWKKDPRREEGEIHGKIITLALVVAIPIGIIAMQKKVQCYCALYLCG